MQGRSLDFPEVGAQFFKSSLPGLPADWPCGQLKDTVKVRFTDQWRIQERGPALPYLRVWMTAPPPPSLSEGLDLGTADTRLIRTPHYYGQLQGPLVSVLTEFHCISILMIR